MDNLEKNWNKYYDLCGRFCDHNLTKMLDDLGERIVSAPASNREPYGFCRPGGLLEHSLDIASRSRSMIDKIGGDVSISAVMKVSLLHDLGKIGDLENDLFIEETSSWHIEKLGQLYKYNENIRKMTIPHRTLFLLQHYGVKLTPDEWLAIATAQGSHLDENKFYEQGMNRDVLSIILQTSKKLSFTLDS